MKIFSAVMWTLPYHFRVPNPGTQEGHPCGRNPKILLFPKDYVSGLLATANRQIKRINKSQFAKMPPLQAFLPDTGVILADVPSIPPKAVIECYSKQGVIAYLGEKGLIDIFSSSTTPEGDGRFMIYNLLPGEYTVAGYSEDLLIFLERVLVKNNVVTFISGS